MQKKFISWKHTDGNKSIAIELKNLMHGNTQMETNQLQLDEKIYLCY
jgi:hypothetical protein